MKTKRGISYFGNRHLKHVAADLKDIKKHHCNWVLHTYDEVDLKFNRGQMKTITAMSHDMGLDVWYSPWAIGSVFGGESISAFTGRNPDACQVLNTGEHVAAACPAHPKFRAFMKTWIEACVVESKGDVMFWDEPHLWIASWEGRKDRDDVFSVGSAYAQELFKKRYRMPLPKRRTKEVDEFRDWLMVDFIKWATATSKQMRSSIKNAVCLLPWVKTWPEPEWEGIAEIKSVDIMSTDPYWKSVPHSKGVKRPLEGFVDLMSERIVELGRRHKKEVQTWIQIFAHKKEDEADISKAVRMMEKAGITNFAGWGYEGCGAYSNIAAERPRHCWDRLGREYARLARKK